ncbi:hypothetical protein BXZ70DRAFT_1010834 [Cristinia sonorae]|uniref:Uncharacterized protein n=1 Tax=Cristinia sonorae TaxID=1940300 RepID=A0A8K0XM83_9AGAR|nr:hypothetical protein BXZ70DRAFT_1010834 [Cristinia sonorae]
MASDIAVVALFLTFALGIISLCIFVLQGGEPDRGGIMDTRPTNQSTHRDTISPVSPSHGTREDRPAPKLKLTFILLLHAVSSTAPFYPLVDCTSFDITFTPPYHQQGFSRLLRWLKAHPHLSPFIRDLHLVVDDAGFVASQIVVRPTVDAYLLLPMLRRLPNLRWLDLRGVGLGGPQRVACPYSNLSTGAEGKTFSLQRLTIRDLCTPGSCNMENLLEVLSLFDEIDTFDVENLWTVMTTRAIISPTPVNHTVLRIRALHLGTRLRMMSQLARVFREVSVSSLRELRVDCTVIHSRHIPFVGSLVQLQLASGNGLEAIEITLPGLRRFVRGPILTVPWSALSLQSCVSLNHLSLRLFIPRLTLLLELTETPVEDPFSPICTAVIEVLSCPPTQPLRTITLYLLLDGDRQDTLLFELTKWDWHRLEALLCRFENLQKMLFVLEVKSSVDLRTVSETEDVLRGYIIKQLPGAHKKGWICVSSSSAVSRSVSHDL